MGADRGAARWYASRLVDVGGRRLAMRTAGHGRPAVVLEMGLGAAAGFFDDVAREMAALARVVWYDRAGLGHSDRAPVPRTVADLADDLHTLLRVAAIPGPYILVGHSLGGLIVRFYRQRHPLEVAALVLIDAAHEEQRARLLAALPPESPGEPPAITRARHGLSVAWADPTANPEGIDNIGNSALMGACRDLGDLPLVVVSRGRPAPVPDGFPPELVERREQTWREMQRELAALSSRGVHLIAERGGHLVNQDQPELVVEGIRRALTLVGCVRRGRQGIGRVRRDEVDLRATTPEGRERARPIRPDDTEGISSATRAGCARRQGKTRAGGDRRFPFRLPPREPRC